MNVAVTCSWPHPHHKGPPLFSRYKMLLGSPMKCSTFLSWESLSAQQSLHFYFLSPCHTTIIAPWLKQLLSPSFCFCPSLQVLSSPRFQRFSILQYLVPQSQGLSIFSPTFPCIFWYFGLGLKQLCQFSFFFFSFSSLEEHKLDFSLDVIVFPWTTPLHSQTTVWTILLRSIHD